MRLKTRACRAYTLVEVLIVVTVIGIASAVVVPHMLDASTLGIQAAARSVMADVIYAQNEAVVQQTRRRVVVDTTAERYWLVDPADPTQPLELDWRVGGGESFIDFLTDERFRGVTLAKVTGGPGSYTFIEDDGQVVFEFDELGSPIQGGGQSVGLVADDQRFVITVAEFTGRVTVAPVGN